MIPLRRPEEAPETAETQVAAEPPARLEPTPSARSSLDVHELQVRAEAWAVGRALDRAAEGHGRWSARRSLAFMVGATLFLWSCIFAVGWLVARGL
jgi:hypothetical protein